MFTIPAGSSGGLLLAARPSASSGTITNAANAYDLPLGRDDDPPYTTYAAKSTVTGSATPGTVDYDLVEYNTFPSRSKTTFTACSLSIGVTSSLSAMVVSSSYNFKTGFYETNFVTPSLSIEYQIDGSSWVNISSLYAYDILSGQSLGDASNLASFNTPTLYTDGVSIGMTEKVTLTKIIPASSFPSDLNTLKIRFKLGTCTNNSTTSYQSSGSYLIWDIRANIS